MRHERAYSNASLLRRACELNSWKMGIGPEWPRTSPPGMNEQKKKLPEALTTYIQRNVRIPNGRVAQLVHVPPSPFTLAP